MAVDKCARCGKTRSGKIYKYYYGTEVAREEGRRERRRVDVVQYQVSERSAFICNRCALQHGIWRPLLALFAVIPFLAVGTCGLIYTFELIAGGGDLTPPMFYLFLGLMITLMGLAVAGFAYFARDTWRWHRAYQTMCGGKLPFSNKYAMEVMAMELDPPAEGQTCFTSYDYQKMLRRSRGLPQETSRGLF